jgi:hypothetical protein
MSPRPGFRVYFFGRAGTPHKNGIRQTNGPGITAINRTILYGG